MKVNKVNDAVQKKGCQLEECTVTEKPLQRSVQQAKQDKLDTSLPS